jgi:MFS family permease
LQNSYGVTFGSFLLLWGKVSDIHSAKPVFSIGLMLCGLISLIISFMTNDIALYVFRALYGIAAAATVSWDGIAFAD